MGALLEKWQRAKSETKFYDGQLLRIAETAIFKRMLSGQAAVAADEKAQLFRSQSKNIFNAILDGLDPNGTPVDAEQDSHKATKKRSEKSKERLANDAFSYIRENAIDGLYKQINANKAAVRLDKKDFEVALSAHRTPVVDMSSWTQTIVDGKIPESIQKLANYLLNLEYDVLMVKNNQIVFNVEGSQYSIRLTGKTKLF